MKIFFVFVSILALFFATPVSAVQNEKFKNCTALNSKYPGGIAKNASAKNKNKKGELVKSKKMFEVNAKLYESHRALDRDKDNIVCEK